MFVVRGRLSASSLRSVRGVFLDVPTSDSLAGAARSWLACPPIRGDLPFSQLSGLCVLSQTFQRLTDSWYVLLCQSENQDFYFQSVAHDFVDIGGARHPTESADRWRLFQKSHNHRITSRFQY